MHANSHARAHAHMHGVCVGGGGTHTTGRGGLTAHGKHTGGTVIQTHRHSDTTHRRSGTHRQRDADTHTHTHTQTLFD